ncbi:unnamed protein product [Lactuca virosa]|uniref:PPM-type phosphatase domain-containing protein n=1 Tax=Lactuca virosa TaxID=75947 RepID=A0AAU9MZK9_9ASTR|nr:unnamed protein product [Lactuca virosa]
MCRDECIEEINKQALRNVVVETEKRFNYFAREALKHIPNIYSVGSCCRVGIIWNKKLFIANLGDSRAVLGRANPRNLSKVIAQPLTNDHNASMMEVRRDLQLDHPEDLNILERLFLSLGELFGLFNWSESGDVVEARSAGMEERAKASHKAFDDPFSLLLSSLAPKQMRPPPPPNDGTAMVVVDGIVEG